MNVDLIVPGLTGAALLWWIGRGMSMIARLATIAITLGLIAIVILVERAAQ